VSDTAQLELRLYGLSQSLWRNELESQYANVVSIGDVFSQRLVDYLRTLPPPEQKAVARTLSRRWNTAALAAVGESLSEEDEQRVAAFTKLVSTKLLGGYSEKEIARRAFESVGNISMFKRRESMAAVVAAFNETVGSRGNKLGGGGFVWHADHPAAAVSITLDFGSRRPTMDVSYQVHTKTGDPVRRQYSFLAALGIRSETKWILVNSETTWRAISVATSVTRKLLDALASKPPAVS
jgi:hypothetical protein